MAAEDKLIAHVKTDSAPDEVIHSMAGCRLAPGPVGTAMLLFSMAFFLLPAIIVYDIVAPPVYAVITNKRLVFIRGNARTGFLRRKSVVELDQIEKVEVKKGWYDAWTVRLKGGKTLRMSELSKKGGWGVTTPNTAKLFLEGPAFLEGHGAVG